MPAMAPLVLKDGQSTPANHTFNPLTTNPVPTFFEAGTTPLANKVLTCDLRAPGAGANAVYRETVQVVYPVVQDLTGSNGLVTPTVVRVLRKKDEILIPASSTLQERKDIVAYGNNFYLDASAKQVHENLTPFYG